jgi:hypothetical protein
MRPPCANVTRSYACDHHRASVRDVAVPMSAVTGADLADSNANANPLDNIRNTQSIHWVMKNGRLYEGDILNEVWPATRPGPTAAD